MKLGRELSKDEVRVLIALGGEDMKDFALLRAQDVGEEGEVVGEVALVDYGAYPREGCLNVLNGRKWQATPSRWFLIEE